MAFTNIRHVELDIAAHIRLTDDAILHLVSTCPFLEHLSINETTGWNRPEIVNGYITLDGLRQLLTKCPLLNHIGLVVHATNTITEAAAQSLLDSRSSFRGTFYINVMDSIIDSELSIPAIATFLAYIICRCDELILKAWGTFNCQLYPKTTVTVNRARWNNVANALDELIGYQEGAGN